MNICFYSVLQWNTEQRLYVGIVLRKYFKSALLFFLLDKITLVDFPFDELVLDKGLLIVFLLGDWDTQHSDVVDVDVKVSNGTLIFLFYKLLYIFGIVLELAFSLLQKQGFLEQELLVDLFLLKRVALSVFLQLRLILFYQTPQVFLSVVDYYILLNIVFDLNRTHSETQRANSKIELRVARVDAQNHASPRVASQRTP